MLRADRDAPRIFRPDFEERLFLEREPRDHSAGATDQTFETTDLGPPETEPEVQPFDGVETVDADVLDPVTVTGSVSFSALDLVLWVGVGLAALWLWNRFS